MGESDYFISLIDNFIFNYSKNILSLSKNVILNSAINIG